MIIFLKEGLPMPVVHPQRRATRSKLVQTRLRPAERELVEKAAEHDAMSVSAWARAVLVQSAKAELDGSSPT